MDRRASGSVHRNGDHHVRPCGPVLTLNVRSANRAGAHASALGELLLRQPRLLAVPSEQPPEPRHHLMLLMD